MSGESLSRWKFTGERFIVLRVSFDGGNFAIQSWPRVSSANTVATQQAAMVAEETIEATRDDFPTAQMSRFRVKLEAAQASAMRLKLSMGDRYRVHAISSDEKPYTPEEEATPEEALSELKVILVTRWRTSVQAQANSTAHAVMVLVP